MVIILWVFNWICWKRKCCCLEAFDEYCNKVFSWWLSWVFLCGILACCIAGFVTANRFGFASYGVQCAYERIYYDSKYGKLKKTYPKWEGFKELNKIRTHLNNTIKKIANKNVFLKQDLFYNKSSEIIKEKDDYQLNELFFYPIPENIADSLIEKTNINKNITLAKEDIKDIKKHIYFKIVNYNQICKYSNLIKENDGDFYLDQIKQIKIVEDMEKNFEKYKSKFIKDFLIMLK